MTMSKELKKTLSLINEKEALNREILSKVTVEIESTEAKLQSLKAELDSAESSDQYKELMKEIRDYEDVLKFCKKKKAVAESNTLTDAEYKAVLAELKKARDSMKMECKKQLIADVEKLTSTLSMWDLFVTESNGVAARINGLSGGRQNLLQNAQTIADGDYVLLGYVDTFYRLKAYIAATSGGLA